MKSSLWPHYLLSTSVTYFGFLVFFTVLFQSFFPPSESGFLFPLYCWHFELSDFLFWELILWIEGYLAASLASAHWTPIAHTLYTPPSSYDKQKCLHTQMSPARQNHPQLRPNWEEEGGRKKTRRKHTVTNTDLSTWESDCDTNMSHLVQSKCKFSSLLLSHIPKMPSASLITNSSRGCQNEKRLQS